MSELTIETGITGNGGCPFCGNFDTTIPIHQLYADMLAGAKMPEMITPGISREKLRKLIFPPLIPKKDLVASMNPDLIVTLSLILVAYMVFTQLNGLKDYLIPIGIGIILIIGIYIYMRRLLVDRYKSAIKAREVILARIRAKADIWMELIYCPKDNLVFLPDHSLKLELEQLKDYINSDLNN